MPFLRKSIVFHHGNFEHLSRRLAGLPMFRVLSPRPVCSDLYPAPQQDMPGLKEKGQKVGLPLTSNYVSRDGRIGMVCFQLAAASRGWPGWASSPQAVCAGARVGTFCLWSFYYKGLMRVIILKMPCSRALLKDVVPLGESRG